MTSNANKINGGMLIARNELSMPKWVTEQSDRIGPRPPPLPTAVDNDNGLSKPLSLPPKTKQPEPDYEIIEFSNQPYTNAPLRPNSANSGSKTPDTKLNCTLCGSGNPWVTCAECSQQIFCASCDDMFHKHPKRKTHQRKTLERSRPPLPPKVLPGQSGALPPVAPPRRGKRGLMTPVMQRKDQANAMLGEFPEPISPTPSAKSSSWQDRVGSLPRGLNFLNRPLPETPKSPSGSSRSTTPKSVFDNIQRPPSVVLEKIKSKANATLDRMQLLQQRYKQQKEQMERERSGSVTDQNLSAFDQWSSISQSPSHFRSGSISSGINSSHLDLMDDTNFNLFHQRQMSMQHQQMAAQRAKKLGQRGISNSVFNLNHINRKQSLVNNDWMNNAVHQAQSMAQLNCKNCVQHQIQSHDPWSNQLASQHHLNRSNMSLNVSAGYMMQPHMNNMYPPPAFMNQRNIMAQMYPQPYMPGMPVMNPGLICMPPANSRAPSRSGSRVVSPAMSRKSITLRRKQRSSYMDEDATDDEDSDEDDRRSITSTRSGAIRARQRRMSSASQFQFDDDTETTQSKLHRNRIRNHRRDSVAKSVNNDWAPGKRGTSNHNNNSNNRSADSGFNSPLKPSRIYSDLDSEGSGTRALVQAKIEQKLKEESLKQKQNKSKRNSRSPPTQKTSAAVQTPALKSTKKQHEETQKSATEAIRKEEPTSERETVKEQQVIKMKESVPVAEKQASGTEEEKGEPYENQNESESELSEQSGTKEEIEGVAETEDGAEQTQENRIDEDDLGPPPSTPDHEWECEFCTFVNEANIKICSICCKTPSVKAKKAKQTTNIMNGEEQVHLAGKQNSKERNTKFKSSTIKKSPLTSATNSAKNLQTTTTASNQATDNRNGSASHTTENKGSVEDVWASLDENIQATANEITRKAQSNITSASKSASNESKENKTTSRASQAREIGTSPPPQTISTQTYDTLPTRTETIQESVIKPMQQAPFNDVIQHTNLSFSPKIQNLKSFEAEVLNNIHNISHVPSSTQYQNRSAHQAMYSYNDRQRYRSNNDLRLDDTMPLDFDAFNGLGKRHPSINELMLIQKTSSQTHSPFGGSTYDLPYRELSSIRLNDMEHHKESDLYKHTTEELNAAIKYCGPDVHPLIWLRDNWPKLIQTVQSLATKYGQERAENTIGTISQMEAREALRKHTGNIWQAVSECIEQRQRKYREISSKGNFSREDIVTALTIHQGNLELALNDLGRTQLKPFLMRIWGSPAGVENESGSQSLVTTTTSDTHYMDKDIHSFLSANASECMQTLNDTGAYPINNQTPSPFDRPASFNSPFENNNHVLDNTSSYSADSKNFVSNSLPLDESILSNKNVLKDLETLIGNMEHNQQKQNEHVLRSIQEMITNINLKNENDYDPEAMRILTKSPIISPKLKITPKDGHCENESDVKSFVWQHIQEIMPNLVQQVELELVADIEQKTENEDGKPATEDTSIHQQIERSVPPPPPIDHDEFLMEEVIKPNIRNASIREELPPQYIYTAEIATFQMAFDKALEKGHEQEFNFETLKEVSRKVYKMFKHVRTENSLQQSEDALKEDNEKKQVFNTISSEHKFDLLENENASATENPKFFKDLYATNNENVLSLNGKNLSNDHPNFQIKENAQDQMIALENIKDLQDDEYDQFIRMGKGSQRILKTEHLDKPTPQSTSPSNSSTINNEVSNLLQESLNLAEHESVKEASKSFPTINKNSDQENSTLTETMQHLLHSTGNGSDQVESISLPTRNNSSVHENFSTSTETLQHPLHSTENRADEIEPISLPTRNNNSVQENSSTSTETLQHPLHSTENRADEIESISLPTRNNTSVQENSSNSNEILQDRSLSIENESIHQSRKAEKEINESLKHNIDNSEFIEDFVRVSFSHNLESTVQLPEETHVLSEENNASSGPKNTLGYTKDDNNSSYIAETNAPLPVKPENQNLAEQNSLANETIIFNVNKKISKIPVRRTVSNKSLVNASALLNKNDIKNVPKTQQSNLTSTAGEIYDNNFVGNDLSEDEFYRNESNKSTFIVAPRMEQSQSPITTSEMLLVIEQEASENASTIAPSISSSTLLSTISQSSSLKSPNEFVPSGDPTKQNLTELVEDTQRLIKQMKDEISIDDFESSTDDGDYSDEFSDEYDDDELDEEEEWREEEQDDDYDDVTEDITEENYVFSPQEEVSSSEAHSPLPSLETQDHRTVHNSSVLSNITESSDHSLPFIDDHLEQNDPIIHHHKDTQDPNNIVDTNSSATEPKTENNLEQLPFSEEYVESENSQPEMSVEIILSHVTTQDNETRMTHNNSTEKDISPIASGSIETSLASASKTNHLLLENRIPELPVEAVMADIKIPIQNIKNHFNLNNNADEIQQAEERERGEKNSDHLTSAISSEKENLAVHSDTFIEQTIDEQKIGNQSPKASGEEINSAEKQTDSIPASVCMASAGIVGKNASDSTTRALDETNSNHKPLLDNLPSSSNSVKGTQTKQKTNEPIKNAVKKSLTASKIPKPKEITKEPKSKEVRVTKPSQNEFKKKAYARSKSFSGPPTPIGISSVKSISQKFINPPTLNKQPTVVTKQSNALRRSSITETINKFAKPSESSGKSVINSLFKSRKQPRIPKKKYHETCFSDDDFESSTEDEEIEPLEVRQRKLSVPVFKAYPSVQEPAEVDTEQLVDKFVKEELAATVAEAQIAAALVSMKFQQDVSLWAAKECSDLGHAIALLKQECELCSGTYALNQIVSMLTCTHKCCKQCAKTYFTVQITERSINDCSCPFCKLPELHNQTEHEDENLEYFSNLDIFLKNILETEVHELFQRKLRDRTLLKDPNFKWCIQCSSGFFARPKQKRLICPDCGSVTCAQCRKTWQKQHEGISCDQFAKWEAANDPEVQAKGVQQHLDQHGIDCPKCKFKYSLARGGCMHFTCTQCKYEFCYGCAKPFMMGAKCNISAYCAKLGLHAHHPRNCLFYLRDKLPVQLQILLKNNNVSFEVDPIEMADSLDDDVPRSSRKNEIYCPIAIQKETPTGLVDTRCNGDVPEKHAGMCRNHYVEYLTAKVAKAKIDPLPVFDLTDCVQELRRRGIALPERGPWDTDEIYKNMCAELIQKNIPLDVD